MFVYLYQCAFTVGEDRQKKLIRVVAADVKSAIATVEAAVPGAVILAVPNPIPVDAIAASIDAGKVEIQPKQAVPNQQPQMMPGMMPQQMVS